MRKWISSTAAALILAAGGCATKDQAPKPEAAGPQTQSPASQPVSPPAATPESAQLPGDERELAALMKQQYDAHEYEKAVWTGKAIIALDPTNVEIRYNLACMQALAGHKDDALATLAKTVSMGLSDVELVTGDADLVSLHADPRFADVLAGVKANDAKQAAAEKNKPFEQGVDVPGVKTVEDFPEGGLRYRLRMSPAATAQKPDRLIVWLHPSGGSMDPVVERLSPRFIAKGFALLVLTQKQYMEWRGVEATKLVKRTLPVVAKLPGIDARKPLLMGFSAGGQLALELYFEHPSDWGGVILDAAYPLGADPAGGGRLIVIDAPQKPGVKDVPIFALVGGADGAAVIWRTAQPRWTKAGVPLTLSFIPDKGHAWLFDEERLAALEAWLTQVAAGGKPGEVKAATHPAASAPSDR